MSSWCRLRVRVRVRGLGLFKKPRRPTVLERLARVSGLARRTRRSGCGSLTRTETLTVSDSRARRRRPVAREARGARAFLLYLFFFFGAREIKRRKTIIHFLLRCCLSVSRYCESAIDVRATVTHAHLCPPRHGVEQPALLRALLHRASERLHRTRLAEGGACTVKGGGWLGRAWSGPAYFLGAHGCPEPPGAP